MKHLFLALLPVMLLSMVAEAQEVVPVTVQGQVTVHNKDNGKDIRERVEYTLLTKQQAQEAKAAFDRLTGEGDKSQNISEDEIEAIDRLKRKYGFVKKNTTRASGRFTINAATTLCLLFITGQEAKVSDIIEIEPGKTEYDVVINVQRLREVVKQGKAVERESIGGGGGDTGDGNSYFHISLNIPKGIGKESSRLIIQTYAVCCQTDDTVAYCEPLVYEGKEYHELQNKRMDYDYFRNDLLADAYRDGMELSSDEWIRIDTTLVYEKEDKNLDYRGPFTYVLEDYHHVYKKGGWGGTCLFERPFKFVDFTPALAELPLSEEFREDAQSQFGQENRDLQLRFVVGKDVLEEDSMNQVNIDKLISELRSYGDKLVAPKIQGFASPEGSMKVNQDLALRRAQYAARIIQRYLPSGVTVSSSSSVYTWNDVVDALAKKVSATTDFSACHTIVTVTSIDTNGGITSFNFYKNTAYENSESDVLAKLTGGPFTTANVSGAGSGATFNLTDFKVDSEISAPDVIKRYTITGSSGSIFAVQLNPIIIPNNYYSESYGINPTSEVADIKLSGGSTGFFDDEDISDVEFKWRYSALLVKAFRGEIDPRIQSPTRCPAKFLFDAGYNTIVGSTILPYLTYTPADIINASIIFTDEDKDEVLFNPDSIAGLRYEDIDVKQAMYDLMIYRCYQGIPEDKRPEGPGSGLSLHLDSGVTDANTSSLVNTSFAKRFDNPNASWDIGGWVDVETGLSFTWTKP